MKKPTKKTTIFVSILLAIVLILAILPGIAKNYIVKNSKELIGRQIAIEKLSLNYLTSTVSVDDFTMFETDGKTSFVSFDKLKLNTSFTDLIFSKIKVQSLDVKGLEASIVQKDSIFNFDDIVAFYTSSEDSIPDDESEEPINLILKNIALQSCKLRYEDQSLNSILTIDSINGVLPKFKYGQTEDIKADLAFQVNQKGTCNLSLSCNLESGDYNIISNIDQLYLQPFLPYTKDYIVLETLNGMLDSELTLTGNFNDTNSMEIQGNSTLNGIELYTNTTDKIMSAKAIRANYTSLKPMASTYILGDISITDPYVYFEIRDSLASNFDDLLAPYNNLPIDSTAVESTSDSLYYFIKSLAVDNGKLSYTDATTPEPFSYDISNMVINTDSIASDMDWVVINANSVLNNRGQLIATLGIDPSDPYHMDLEYGIEDFQLTDLNIYSKHYMGFPLLNGDMFYNGKTTIVDNQLISDNKLFIGDVEVGERVGGLYSLPLKFAIFILKDKNGDIKLDIPVKGDLNDPSVSIGKILWKTFKNIIIRTASSPVNKLASLIGADPKNLNDIEFDYGVSTLNQKQTKVLDQLLELEAKKEGLKIKLKYFNDNSREQAFLAVLEMKKQYNPNNYKDIKDTDEGFLTYLKGRLSKETISLNDDCISLVGKDSLSALQQPLNTERFNAVENYLKSFSDSTLIKVQPYFSDSPKNVGTTPVFEITYAQ